MVAYVLRYDVMALTRRYRETVLDRIKNDPEFTAALYAEAITSLVEGDKEMALSVLRDLVHAHVSFKTLAKQTGFDEKALHRMLGKNGNPTMENLTKVIHTIEEDLQLSTHVEAHWRKPRKRTVHQRDVKLAYA
jgi:DNA-binding phage protein